MEVEYVACLATIQEAIWLRRFTQHLDIMTRVDKPVEMFSNSMDALKYVKDPKYHDRTKHIDICFHYIREMTRLGEVTLRHISTTRMVADPLTKPINRDVFLTPVRNLGLHRI